jgi:hypothetical protein
MRLILEDGRALAEGLPSGAVTFQLELAGKAYAHPHDTNLSKKRIVLPAHGRVQIRWSERTAAQLSRKLILTPKSDRGAPLVSWLMHGSAGHLVFPSVLPDEYELRIVAAESDEDPGRPLLTQPGLTVIAGRTNRFSVGR